MLTVGAVSEALQVEPVGNADPAQAITAVVYDSRQAVPGCLFVAIPGEAGRDGWNYVPNAVAAGAVAILAQRPPAPEWLTAWQPASATASAASTPGHPPDHDRSAATTPSSPSLGGPGEPTSPPRIGGMGEPPPGGSPAYFTVPRVLQALAALAAAWRARHPVRCIGITGAVGKTSTKEALAAVLGRRWRTLKNESSLNNEIGVPVTLLRLDSSHERYVQELGTYGPGEVRFLCSIVRPVTGIVTNIGPSHLERMGSLENIARCEGEIVECLPRDGIACLNYDDPLVLAMRRRTRARVLTYGISAGADLRAVDVEELGLQGVRLRLLWGGEAVPVQVPIPGRPGLWIALAAAAGALAEGMPPAEVAAGLGALPGPTRLVPRTGRNGSLILDDHYNASPVSTRAALDLLAQTPAGPGGRKIVVLADMLELGEIAEAAHREMGRRIVEVADALIAVGPLATRYVADEARRLGLADVETYADAAEVPYEPQPGDVILVKGSRGMRTERLVARLVAASR